MLDSTLKAIKRLDSISLATNNLYLSTINVIVMKPLWVLNDNYEKTIVQ